MLCLNIFWLLAVFCRYSFGLERMLLHFLFLLETKIEPMVFRYLRTYKAV
jgi:hypothetical protein